MDFLSNINDNYIKCLFKLTINYYWPWGNYIYFIYDDKLILITNYSFYAL